MVDTKQVAFDLPNMRMNPFNIKPLNYTDKQLLVGRREIISKINGWCKHRSSRMILLVGNRGTGRTSLLNLVGNNAFRHFQFNLFPTNDPMKNLLEELYITVVSDFEVPRMHQQLQENLINSLPNSGRLPILSFDYPNIPGSDIAEVFKQISQILRTLDAVSIIALTPSQLATWPQELIDEFDEEIRIKSFNESEILEMITKRIQSSSRGTWNPPSGLVQEIEERTSGHPSESIKLMRKIVHFMKNEDEYDSELNQILSNIRTKIDGTEEINQIKKEARFEDSFEEELPTIEDETDFEDGFEEELPTIEDETDFEDIFEEELPTIEDEIKHELSNEDEILQQGITQQNIEPFNYNEEPTKIFSEQSHAPLPKGGFGKLSGRTRNTNESMRKDGFAVFPSDFEAIKKQQEPPSLESPTLETENVALWIDDQMISKTSFGNEYTREINNNNQIIQEKASFEELKSIQENTKINPSEQSFNLDITKLRSLDNNEIEVIKLCSIREISPSDEEIRQRLGGIGRTRVSQICNGLHKHGILSVKKAGRSRMFYLSNSAKSQLMAWNIL